MHELAEDQHNLKCIVLNQAFWANYGDKSRVWDPQNILHPWSGSAIERGSRDWMNCKVQEKVSEWVSEWVVTNLLFSKRIIQTNIYTKPTLLQRCPLTSHELMSAYSLLFSLFSFYFLFFYISKYVPKKKKKSPIIRDLCYFPPNLRTTHFVILT